MTGGRASLTHTRHLLANRVYHCNKHERYGELWGQDKVSCAVKSSSVLLTMTNEWVPHSSPQAPRAKKKYKISLKRDRLAAARGIRWHPVVDDADVPLRNPVACPEVVL